MMLDEENILDELESKYQMIHSRLEAKRYKGIIYHYTDYEGLKGILKDRKMRYTDYRDLNDITELKFGQNVILDCIKNKSIPDKERLTKDINYVFFVSNTMCNTYISCYSSTVNKLALWRYYADDGCGFSIGFSSDYHSAVENSTVEIDTLGKVTVSEVLYGEKSVSVISELIEIYIEILNKNPSLQTNKTFLMDFRKKLLSHLLSFLPSLKDESYEDEDEIRLYCQDGGLFLIPSTMQPFYFSNDKKMNIPNEDRRDRRFVHSLSYKRILYPEEQFDHAAICEIWVGPCCDFGEAKKALNILLREHGYTNVEIRQTELPYRR